MTLKKEKKKGTTVSFFLLDDVIETLNRMSDNSAMRSRSQFVEEIITNVAAIGGVEKLREIRYKMQ